MLCDFTVNAPYPDIKVIKKNSCYANILLENYAGKVSAYTSIDLYVYQSISTKANWPDFSTLIRSMAILKMRHLRFLGDTIKLLGGNPNFKTNKNCTTTAWTADYVNPNVCSKKDILRINIDNETNTIKNFRNSIKCIKDPFIIALLERLILDDQSLLKCFNNIFSSL